jgi:hypothetical protein
VTGLLPDWYSVSASVGMMTGTGNPSPVQVKKGETAASVINLTMP